MAFKQIHFAKKVRREHARFDDYDTVKGYYNNLILLYSYPYCGLNGLTLNQYHCIRNSIFHELKRVEQWLNNNKPNQ